MTVQSNTGPAIISTQNLVPAGVATANSAIEFDVSQSTGAAVQVTGVYTGALSLQGTVDGVNWTTYGGNCFVPVATGTAAATILSAATGLHLIPAAFVLGVRRLRITALAAVTGSATVTVAQDSRA